MVLAGDGIILRDNVRLDAACVIGEGVTVGQGTWVRAGAVVLSSVPANAIVEGNPAQVVGYIDGGNSDTRPDPRLLDIHGFDHLERPARVPLDVDDSALYLMRRVTDARGALTVGEVPTEVPFSPARYFAVFDVPSVELRGEHAHKQCQQFLICLHGSCRVLLDDGLQRCEVALDRPDRVTAKSQYRRCTDVFCAPEAMLNGQNPLDDLANGNDIMSLVFEFCGEDIQLHDTIAASRQADPLLTKRAT